MKIQLEFEESAIEQIEDVKRVTGIATYKDLFENALSVFSWAVQQTRDGRKVASVDDQKHEFKELEMPSLERAARFAGKKTAA